MKNILFILLCLIYLDASAQTNQQIGRFEQSQIVNNKIVTKIITNPLVNTGENRLINENQYTPKSSVNASSVTWNFLDPYAIANDMMISGDGTVGYCGWSLNSKRVSAYGNANSTPFWEFNTSTLGYRNYIASSDTGIVAVGAYLNFYLFDKNSNTPLFNFDLTTLPDTGTAGPTGITSNGGFFVATANRNDTSTIFGFNKSSNISVWKFRVPTAIQGVKISGNDSLVIVNTYSYYWVLNTFTGAIRYSAASTGGTQTNQCISGNGNIIAIINYMGQVKVYQWNGSTYNFLWQYQEPTGTYYNWISAIDVSYDGNYIAAGTLIFVTSSTYDGRIRYFKVSNGSVPLWSYTGMLDEVSWVAFSKNGKILTASSWGDINELKADFVVFKTSQNVNIPIFALNKPGSPYACSVSNDGTTAIVGGKAVNARAFGYGGTFYNVFIDTATGNVSVGNISGNIPNEYKLEQNYPNPFNPTTNIKYQIPNNSFVTLKVYNILGKEITTLVNEEKKAGYYEVKFSNNQLPGGVYFYRLQTNGFTDTKKLILVK